MSSDLGKEPDNSPTSPKCGKTSDKSGEGLNVSSLNESSATSGALSESTGHGHNIITDRISTVSTVKPDTNSDVTNIACPMKAMDNKGNFDTPLVHSQKNEENIKMTLSSASNTEQETVENIDTQNKQEALSNGSDSISDTGKTNTLSEGVQPAMSHLTGIKADTGTPKPTEGHEISPSLAQVTIGRSAGDTSPNLRKEESAEPDSSVPLDFHLSKKRMDNSCDKASTNPVTETRELMHTSLPILTQNGVQRGIDVNVTNGIRNHRSNIVIIGSDSDDSDSSFEFEVVGSRKTSGDANEAVDEMEVAGDTLDKCKKKNGGGEESGDDFETEKVTGDRKKPVRTFGEVFPKELPPLEYLTLTPDENVVLEPLGLVSGIVDILVVVQANSNSPALYDDTVLFLKERKPLGLVFETFGTVGRPYYSVRFNSSRDIQDRGITVGAEVFFAPKADNLTKFVFIKELERYKGNDGSWEHDNETPIEHKDFSDDEEERRARRQKNSKSRGGIETADSTDITKRKKKRRPQQATALSGNELALLPGDLNKNPFGRKNQRFNNNGQTQWPPRQQFPQDDSRGHGNSGPGMNPMFHPRNAQQPLPSFGRLPSWSSQPGLLGEGPPRPSHSNTMFGGGASTNTGPGNSFSMFHQPHLPHATGFPVHPFSQGNQANSSWGNHINYPVPNYFSGYNNVNSNGSYQGQSPTPPQRYGFNMSAPPLPPQPFGFNGRLNFSQPPPENVDHGPSTAPGANFTSS